MTFLNQQAHYDFEAAQTKWEWLTNAEQAEIEKLQWERLQFIWSDSIKNVIYYRSLVQENRAPRELRNWDDVARIPILDRNTLQMKQDEFCRLKQAPNEYRMSGGSTGTPVRIGVWKKEANIHRIAKLILWQRTGYKPSNRLFLLWGHLHLLGSGVRGQINHFIRKMKDHMLGYKRVNAYSLSPEKCEAIARDIIRFKPTGIIGYASALDYFIRTTEKYYGDFQKLGVKFVMPAGEMAPRNDSYALLAHAFQCPVIEEYAGVEFGQVAMRLGDQRFEVFHDLNYVESCPDSDLYNAERLIVTSLYDRYVPLVRYAPGDGISGMTHLNNRHVAAFRRVEGRIHDAVQLGGGTVIHSMALFHCIHQEPSVLNIQLILRDAGPRLRLVVREGYDWPCEQRIRKRLGDVAAELSGIPIELAEDVATTRAGKRRWINDERSEVARRGTP